MFGLPLPALPPPHSRDASGVVPQSDGTFQLVGVELFDHLDITRACSPTRFDSFQRILSTMIRLLLSIPTKWVLKLIMRRRWRWKNRLRLGFRRFHAGGGHRPTDWFYAQHGPAFATTNISHGQFRMAIMDNGNVRVYSTAGTCEPVGRRR